MPKLMFAWLGSGRTRRRNVGNAGLYLDQAARAGLPVPPGAVLLDEFYRFAVQNDLAAINGQRVYIPDPISLQATIFESVHLPRFEQQVIVLPISRDVSHVSLPALGELASVDSNDVAAFSRALAAAWSACMEDENESRRDVLVREIVAATQQGTARSLAADTVDIVEMWDGLDGMSSVVCESTDVLTLPRLGGWRLPDDTLPPYAQRVQMLMRGVRHSLGKSNWLASWADDGRICWLIGLKKLDLADMDGRPSG